MRTLQLLERLADKSLATAGLIPNRQTIASHNHDRMNNKHRKTLQDIFADPVSPGIP